MIRQQLLATGACGTSTTLPCADFCTCYVIQENGSGCKTDPVAYAMIGTVSSGFCYADDPTSPALAACPANEKQKILFVSKSFDPMPQPNAQVFLICPKQ